MSEQAVRLTKALSDEGLLVEGGWVGFVLACKLENAPQEQKESMRQAFYAGAAHVFSSMLTFSEPGTEPTDKDMARMDALNDEIRRFQKQFEEEYHA